MSQKPAKERVKFDTDPVTRRALRLRAAIEDVDIQDVVNVALKIYLAKEIEEVVQRGLVAAHPSDKEPTEGRKAKGPGKTPKAT